MRKNIDGSPTSKTSWRTSQPFWAKRFVQKWDQYAGYLTHRLTIPFLWATKYPALEQIERENLAIQKERYEIVAKRRFADDADDVALFTGESVPSIFSFNSAANSEDQPIEPMAHGTSAPGSDFPEARSARRAARGRRVESLRQQAGSVAPEQDDLGTWTDDELPSDTAADLADAVHALRTNLARLFEDVKADDFRDPNLGIRKRFEQWRGRYTEDYTNAFGGLALVGVWEFWARVEMAMWNPFEVGSRARRVLRDCPNSHLTDDVLSRSLNWQSRRPAWTRTAGMHRSHHTDTLLALHPSYPMKMDKKKMRARLKRSSTHS